MDGWMDDVFMKSLKRSNSFSLPSVVCKHSSVLMMTAVVRVQMSISPRHVMIVRKPDIQCEKIPLS